MLPFTAEELAYECAQGNVNVRKHEVLPLNIYNYTNKVQYDRNWNAVTLNCRGLILDNDFNLVARPFSKFFNFTEQIPDPIIFGKPCVAADKMDGCLQYNTTLNLWDGGTIKIGKVVSQKLTPTLIGKDSNNNLVPVQVLDWYNNGTKDNWMKIQVDSPVSLKSGAAGWPTKLTVTTNHEVVANGNFIPAGELKVGDYMTTYEHVLSTEALHVLKSGLLGDGCLVKTANDACTYQESHSKTQWDYVEYIRTWVGCTHMNPPDTVSGYGSEMRWIQSPSLKSLSATRKEWYPNGVKIVPNDLSWIDDFTIAKWYMDDGSLSHSEHQQDRATFSTHSFTQEDVTRLATLLNERYGVDAQLGYSKGWYIRINAGVSNQIDSFWSAIAPHIIPSLKYKLPERFRTTIYQPRIDGSVVKQEKKCVVENIEFLAPTRENFPSGRSGFDIKTTTGNYFAKGLLVHNSLGILYPLPSGDYAVATRGSFTSDQALWATNWFRKTYPDYTQPSGVTTLVEIIYPDNRIVLDYQGYEGLVLLSAIDNETGADIEHWNIDWWTGDKAELFLDLTTADDAYHYANRNEFDDKEGLVLTWYKYQQPAYRLKIKNAEYVRLHGIIHNFSKKRVWESLKAGDNFMDALADVPDEFYQMVKEIVGELQAKFDAINYQAKVDFHSLRDVKSNRKAFALRALELQYPKLMFAMLDNKQHSDIIWKMLEPKEETS